MSIVIFLTFFVAVLFFILILNNDNMIVWFVGSLLSMVFEAKVFNFIERRYNYYKYDLIINEIKKKKYRLEYSNNRTGHIKYSKNGEGHSIYVFKGKNAKSAR